MIGFYMKWNIGLKWVSGKYLRTKKSVEASLQAIPSDHVLNRTYHFEFCIIATWSILEYFLPYQSNDFLFVLNICFKIRRRFLTETSFIIADLPKNQLNKAITNQSFSDLFSKGILRVAISKMQLSNYFQITRVTGLDD